MHTTAFWLTVPEEVVRARCRRGAPRPSTGCAASASRSRRWRRSRSCAIRATSATTLGDAGDRTSEGDEPRVPRKVRGGPQPGYSPTLFLYEHVPGGTGLAERIWEQRDVLLARALRLIESCPCTGGCPACVGPGEATRKSVALALLRSAVPTA